MRLYAKLNMLRGQSFISQLINDFIRSCVYRRENKIFPLGQVSVAFSTKTPTCIRLEVSRDTSS